jgi:transcriptional regulator with XRE-family HTH domain
MAQDDTAQGIDIRNRRKALGWSRRELAGRAGIDPRLVQLIELDQWTDGDAIGRVRAVLLRAENGETDVELPPVELPAGTSVTGAGGPVAEA